MTGCRMCGALDFDHHHAVHRRLGGDNHELNLIRLCRSCHQAIHDRNVDLLSHLTLEEQGHAASLIGISRAHRLLAPSVYRGGGMKTPVPQ